MFYTYRIYFQFLTNHTYLPDILAKTELCLYNKFLFRVLMLVISENFSIFQKLAHYECYHLPIKLYLSYKLLERQLCANSNAS